MALWVKSLFGLLLHLALTPAVLAGVDASEYHAFWVWSGVRPQAALRDVREIYLHQAEITSHPEGPRLAKMGPIPSRLKVPNLWVVARVNVLPLARGHEEALIGIYEAWRQAGNPVSGLQIDFDAGTYKLERYAEFLKDLRTRLPADCKLSITGLLDWAKTGDIDVINRLPVDEVIIQTYQGRKTVPGFEAYLPSLLKLTRPFKIGLVQHGAWDQHWQQRLSASPFYRGEVVFLLN